jgi:hypothetical protein
MASPNLPVVPELPSTGARPLTYPELLDKLKCVCTAGAQIRPSSLPSATVDLGDIIADFSKYLTIFTAGYGIITVVLKMIACIIDVLCALMNPFSVISALIRLFGTCLPDFILIFPQLAIPAKIICILKVVLAILEYLLTVIVPLVQDIIQNVENLIAAIDDNNAQGIAAVAFKIASLIKELYSVLGILDALMAVWIMIKALLDAGIGIPCGGSGGSCSGCGDDQCNSTLRQSSITGTDGVLTISYVGTSNFIIRFSSSSINSNLLDLRGFFPKGLNYDEIEDEDDLPYVMTIDGTSYSMKTVNSSGTATLSFITQPFETDGYLSDIAAGVILTDPLDVRFGVDTETFLPSYAGVRYVELIDRNSSSFAAYNNGVWQIEQVYDGYNVRLRRDEDTWMFLSGANPAPHLDWRLVPAAPSVGSNKSFELEINHDELIRHNLIGVGCHPAVKAAIDGFNNRFPDASDPNNLILPDLPDIDALSSSINNCMAAIAPENVTTDYVLDNYDTIAEGAAALQDCILGPSSSLVEFSDDLTDYVEDIYPRIFDQENSTLEVDVFMQVVGKYINITLVPFDVNGARLAQTLPPGIIEATIFSDAGVLSTTQEVFDAYGDSTGDFEATLTSHEPATIKISAQVGGKDVADFNGSTLVKREIEVEVVMPRPERAPVLEGDIPEPLGLGTTE